MSAVILLACSLLASGCGDSGGPERNPVQVSGGLPASRQEASPRPPAPAASPPAETGHVEEPASSGSASSTLRQPPATSRQAEPSGPRTLADLLELPDAPPAQPAAPPRREIDEAHARAFGIRKLSSRQLVLFTDLEADQEVDVLPRVFDQAFAQWCEYFGIDAGPNADWQMTGFLIKDKSRFEKTGLLPEGLPPFTNGYSRGYELWLYEQESAYYRRHLLLHEGTHGLMNTLLGGCGPPWYMEGIAELLATHRWQEGRLTLNYMPRSREEVPMWGRIKIVQDDFAANRARRLASVLHYHPEAFLDTDPYGWCWAAAVLLDRHPRYQDRFRRLPELVNRADFTEGFRQAIGTEWDELTDQWQVFVADLEYGHDIPATAIDFTPGEPLPVHGASVQVEAARGWQNSGLRLEAGTTYRLRASGRYQVATEPQIWWCEPGGVSIRYYKGRPLGALLAAVRADPAVRHADTCELVQPVAVGLDSTLSPAQSGTLFLRINDSAGELDDNSGTLTVAILRESG